MTTVVTNETVPTIGSCKRCKRVHSRTLCWVNDFTSSGRPDGGHWGLLDGSFPKHVECCGVAVRMQHVHGSVNATKCDSKCWNGKGHACSCSCGGANHGRSFRTCGCGPRQIKGDDGICRTCGDPIHSEVSSEP